MEQKKVSILVRYPFKLHARTVLWERNGPYYRGVLISGVSLFLREGFHCM